MKSAVQMKVFIILSHCSTRETSEVSGAGVDQVWPSGQKLGGELSHWL